MSQREVISTDAEELRFDFSWTDSSTAIASFGPTYGTLAVWVGETLVWGSSENSAPAKGISGLWIELLEYLGNYWPYLILEQGYPFNVRPVRPSLLDRELELRWESLDDCRQAKEEELSYAFKLSHNLAESSPGTLRPDLWFIRDGGLTIVEAQLGSRSVCEQLPSASIRQLLTQVGDAIAARLQIANDCRSIKALQEWSNRESESEELLAQIATGLPGDYLLQTVGPDSFSQVLGDPESTWYDENVYLDLIYRCKGELPPQSLRTLLDRVRRSKGTISQALHNISNSALSALATWETSLIRPYQQGRALAIWLRKQVADPSGRVDPELLLTEWDVIFDKEDFGTEELDAVAFWAHSRQPVILWNDSEKHRENEGARRATLAHEIAHLLVDRLTALPLSAVARGAMDRKLEQRANAFAAEFLCPEEEVEAEYLQAGDVELAISRTTARFGVSRELAALQLGKSGRVSDLHHQQKIESIGPRKASYWWEQTIGK